jgi:DNA-binding transcriptional regulator/RsmH inhibitor MraZ
MREGPGEEVCVGYTKRWQKGNGAMRLILPASLRQTLSQAWGGEVEECAQFHRQPALAERDQRIERLEQEIARLKELSRAAVKE